MANRFLASSENGVTQNDKYFTPKGLHAAAFASDPLKRPTGNPAGRHYDDLPGDRHQRGLRTPPLNDIICATFLKV